jgi:hypothetical protein
MISDNGLLSFVVLSRECAGTDLSAPRKNTGEGGPAVRAAWVRMLSPEVIEYDKYVRKNDYARYHRAHLEISRY